MADEDPHLLRRRRRPRQESTYVLVAVALSLVFPTVFRQIVGGRAATRDGPAPQAV